MQDNHSRSSRGIVRGMHFQPGMAKLIRCARGEIVDVLVDIRKGSPTFGEWEAFTLDDENLHCLYCPDGFAHGFCVTSEVADVIYKCSAYYDPSAERGIAYSDPDDRHRMARRGPDPLRAGRERPSPQRGGGRASLRLRGIAA